MFLVRCGGIAAASWNQVVLVVERRCRTLNHWIVCRQEIKEKILVSKVKIKPTDSCGSFGFYSHGLWTVRRIKIRRRS